MFSHFQVFFVVGEGGVREEDFWVRNRMCKEQRQETV